MTQQPTPLPPVNPQQAAHPQARPSPGSVLRPVAPVPMPVSPNGHPAAMTPPMPMAHPRPAVPQAAPVHVGEGAMPSMPAHHMFQELLPKLTREGGERALPSISIQAFCDRTETASLIHEMSRDWRMKRTNLKIFMGGLLAAIEYYHKESTPNLILIESGLRSTELFAQLDQLAAVCDEGTQLVLIGAANDIKLYRQLMDKGVSDYIVPPFHPLSLIRSISDLYVDPDKPFAGRAVAFFGAKGGVGSSTLAHNVAWCLAQSLDQETTLVDLDATWGTTGLDFAYDATEGLEEALEQPDRIDENLLDRIIIRHTSKLSILPASYSLQNQSIMEVTPYETILEGVRSISPLTILDMPHMWTEWTSQILTSVDDVVITAGIDLANLRNTKNLIDYLKAERPNDKPPILILNKMGLSKSNEISVKEFGATVGLEPALVIPFEPEPFIEAANDGKMLAELKSAGSTVEGLKYIAHRIKTGHFPAQIEAQGKAGKKKKNAKKRKGGSSAKPSSKSLFSMLKKKK